MGLIIDDDERPPSALVVLSYLERIPGRLLGRVDLAAIDKAVTHFLVPLVECADRREKCKRPVCLSDFHCIVLSERLDDEVSKKMVILSAREQVGIALFDND